MHAKEVQMSRIFNVVETLDTQALTGKYCHEDEVTDILFHGFIFW